MTLDNIDQGFGKPACNVCIINEGPGVDKYGQ